MADGEGRVPPDVKVVWAIFDENFEHWPGVVRDPVRVEQNLPKAAWAKIAKKREHEGFVLVEWTDNNKTCGWVDPETMSIYEKGSDCPSERPSHEGFAAALRAADDLVDELDGQEEQEDEQDEEDEKDEGPPAKPAATVNEEPAAEEDDSSPRECAFSMLIMSQF